MNTLRVGVSMIAAFCVAGSAAALTPGQVVDNFRLLDHKGDSHELYYLSDMKAVVLMAQGNGCKASRAAVPELKALRDKYRDQGVEFLMINSNLSDTRDAIVKEAEEAGIDLPIMMDPTQIIGESLDLKRNGEVFVIDPQGWKVAYRGPVSSKKGAHLAEAIDAVLAQQPVRTAQLDAPGCAIDMPEQKRRQQHAKISYEKTIAPILIDNCVTCHREGGIGPWQMSSYMMVKGFAPMIREVIRTERMPPWHADPHYGVFKNDRSLSQEEIKTLVHWIEAGAPRGNGPDPLAELKKHWPEWAMGEPDLVLEIPAFEVPATGVIPYQDVRIKNTIGRDVWLKAIDYVPGERAVVHHILGYSMPAATERARGLGALGVSIGGYVPGAAPIRYPEDTGVLLKKDAEFRFQIHYTTNGKAVQDKTRVGLYFQDEAPKYPMRNTVLLDWRIKIPPHTKAYTASASQVIDRDILVYSLTPHSHFRGKASNFVATYPDGKQEILLSVPKYDFNWQTTYGFATPKLLPKGTKLTHSTTYDNSVQNKANPDPNIEVRWGEQSWEEMLYGNVSFRYVDDTTAEVKPQQVSAAP